MTHSEAIQFVEAGAECATLAAPHQLRSDFSLFGTLWFEQTRLGSLGTSALSTLLSQSHFSPVGSRPSTVAANSGNQLPSPTLAGSCEADAQTCRLRAFFKVGLTRGWLTTASCGLGGPG